MKEKFKAHAAQPLFKGIAVSPSLSQLVALPGCLAQELEPELLPHVYSSGQGSVFSQFGSKYALPLGTIRNAYEVTIKRIRASNTDYFDQVYNEVIVPPAQPMPPRLKERLIPIMELDDIVRRSFLVSTSLYSDLYSDLDQKLTGIYDFQSGAIHRLPNCIWVKREPTNLW